MGVMSTWALLHSHLEQEKHNGVRAAVACLRKKKPALNFFIMNVGVLIDK